MEKVDAQNLLNKYKAGNCTDEEIVILEKWYKDLEIVPFSDISELDMESDLAEVYARLPIHEPKKVRLWQRVAVTAAVAVVIFSAGIWFLNKPSAPDLTGQSVTTNDFAPGKSGATLTLASGEKILINDANAGRIANQSGVKISKTEDGQIVYEVTDTKLGVAEYNTLSTSRGQQTQVRLPDGSVVFLNAASSLKYPITFAKADIRRVTLTGEGFFEIAKDKTHPFIVKTDKQEVEVLGTHFNINSYADESAVSTTLLEGSVKVTANGRDQIIKPNEQAITSGNETTVQRVNVEEIVDWKEGDFYLNGVSLKNAMRKIARWYNVEVVFDPSVPADIESTGYISRKNKLSAVLQLIEKSGDVKFQIQGNTVFVSR